MGPYTIMALAWIVCAVWITFVIYTNKNAHPKALFYLFFVEMWERFSYYGMRALLVLYMINGFMSYSETDAYGVYGAYGALVYATPLLGGLLAERFMGYRKAITWGALLMMLGHFLMAFENKLIFFTALTLLIMGNGFFKPNISSLIGKFYSRNDPRRDGAFTIFYMGINIGAFLTGLTCGVIGELEGWHYGFTLAGVGMLAGLIIFKIAERKNVFGDQGYAPYEVEEIAQPDVADDDKIEKFKLIPNAKSTTTGGISNMLLIYVGSFLALPLAWLLIDHNDILDWVLLAIGVGMVGYLISSSFQYEKVQRERLWVVILLFFFAIIFWTFFELAGSALTIFTDNNIDKGKLFTTTMFQSLNPFFIMLFAPVYSWMWIKLSKANMEPNAAVKFGLGLILLGLGFMVLNFGKGMAVAGMIPAMFMVFLYLLHTLGELTLSPVGLSLVTKLSPVKVIGFVMGFWLMASSFAHLLGKHVAQATAISQTEIVTSDDFRSDVGNANLIKLMDAESFQTCLKEDGTIKSCMSTKEFAQQYSALTGTPHFLANIADKEAYAAAEKVRSPYGKKKKKGQATSAFITTDSKYQNEGAPIMLTAEEVAQAKGNSLNESVQTSISQKTLTLSLGVFRLLGFIAIGSGVFLILISPIVGRWMHGIK